VALCFLLYIEHPYTVLSDSGYQALSAYQYLIHQVSRLNYVSLVNPHDLTRNVECPLTDWAPFSAYMFFAAFKAGLAPGVAGRLLAFLASIIGAIGWAWIASLIGLRGVWRTAGVILASAYCLREGLAVSTGTQDYLIYAVAPWLMGAGLQLAEREGLIQKRTIFQTTLLCAALGGVYWLKYSGIFLSLAVLVFLLAGQAGSLRQRPFRIALAVLACYGAAFALPILAQKAYNYSNTGSDLIEGVISRHRPKTAALIGQYISETVTSASTTLFTARPGMERLTQERDEGVFPWIIKLPGIFLVLICMSAYRWMPQWAPGRMASLTVAVPIFGFPALSSITGVRYVTGLGRSCEPYWIFSELVILALISRKPSLSGSAYKWAGTGLMIATAMQFALFLWVPKLELQRAWQFAREPLYAAGPKALGVEDLAKHGTRDIDNQIKSLVRSSSDVIVPAVYSNHGFGTDVYLELAGFGRLLPLSYLPVAISRTQGDGARFYGTSYFESSGPIRIILVAPDTYHRYDFQPSVEQIRERFKDTDPWTSVPVVPADPDNYAHLWTTEIYGGAEARR
jgi:hypothetical protein